MNTINSGSVKAIPIRRKRHVLYQPVYVRCVCNLPDDQCVPQLNPLETNTSICMCFEDSTTGDIWPCYPTSVWEEKVCDSYYVIFPLFTLLNYFAYAIYQFEFSIGQNAFR